MTNQNDENTQIIENANPKDVISGDHITWESVLELKGAIFVERREGVAHYRDGSGYWRNPQGMRLTDSDREDSTITIRRTNKSLPKNPLTVIEPAKGRKYIVAVLYGDTYLTTKAVLNSDGRWYGVWESQAGAYISMPTSSILFGTWQVVSD